MLFDRSCGLLLHLTSLPGDHGVGDIGPTARWFVDFLRDAGQSWWQFLPLGPSDRGHPYMAQSSWAGSPLLISLADLADSGDLTWDEVHAAGVPPSTDVDLDTVTQRRGPLLASAGRRFFERADPGEQKRFKRFCRAERSWLDDWALYAAAKQRFDRAPWWTWPDDLAFRDPDALRRWRRRLAPGIRQARYVQFRFFDQWDRLRRHAHDAGIRLIGDLPIYCSRDSADIWASPQLFQLDDRGEPLAVSGAPPDAFAADGQLWGSPLYDWPRLAEDGYSWWIGRLRGVLRQVDVVRIDHFRAFESYWEVPADAETARSGRWTPGPRDAFFAAVRDSLGDAPLIAEDLGIITREVDELRGRWDLPGMKVLQFAFGQGAASPHLPFFHRPDNVVYTATHDNDTTVGWYNGAPDWEKDRFRRFTASDGGAPHYHMMHTAYASSADLAVVPVQDVLGLGSEARMNTPAVLDGNWRWKLLPGQLDPGAARMLRDLADLFGRLPGQGIAAFAD